MKPSRNTHFAAIALFTGIAVALHVPGLLQGPTLDGAVFTEIAVGLRSGSLPYRDLWDHKPPGIYAAFALAQTVLPGANPWLGPWLLTTAAAVLIAALTYVLLVPTSRRAAVLGGVVVASYVSLYPISLGGGQTEPLATAAALAAFGVAARGPCSMMRVALCGVLLGIASLTSILVLPAGVGVAIVLARPGARAILCLAVVAIGAGAVGAITLLALWAGAILPEAWSAIVTYSAAYGALNREHADRLVSLGLASVLFLAPLLVPCAAALVRPARTRAADRVAIGAAVWVALVTLAIVASGRLEPHYLIVVVPPLALLAVPAARTMLVGTPHSLAAAALVITAILVAIPAAFVFVERTRPFDNQAQVQEVATWLRARTMAGERLFVWGNEPEVYYESGLSPATPFVYVFPVLTPGYGGPDLSERVACDLVSDLPRFVIDAGSARPGLTGIVPLLVRRPVDPGDGRTLDAIEPIRNVVRDHYGPAVEVAGWLIYERLPVRPAAEGSCRNSGRVSAHGRQADGDMESLPTALRTRDLGLRGFPGAVGGAGRP